MHRVFGNCRYIPSWDLRCRCPVNRRRRDVKVANAERKYCQRQMARLREHITYRVTCGCRRLDISPRVYSPSAQGNMSY
jgi:putative hemolysin